MAQRDVSLACHEQRPAGMHHKGCRLKVTRNKICTSRATERQPRDIRLDALFARHRIASPYVTDLPRFFSSSPKATSLGWTALMRGCYERRDPNRIMLPSGST